MSARTSMSTVALLIALLALLACSTAEREDDVTDPTLPFAPAGPRQAPDSSREGPYPVGVTTRSLADASRTDYVPPKGPRLLTVELFYPAVEGSRAAPRHTFTIADGLTPPALAMVGADYGTFALPSRAARAAPPREGRYPLVLFSHGAGGFRLQSYRWLEHLASHGFVVASVEHPGDTLSDFVLLGQTDLAARLIMSDVYRGADLAFVLGAVLADEDVGAHVDQERIGASGHSHGAVSAVHLARRDPRIRSLVLHGPPGCNVLGLFDGVPVEDLDIPVLIQAGDVDGITPPATTTSAYDCFEAKKARERYARVGHFTFTVACRLPRPLLESLSRRTGFDLVAEGCSEGNVMPDDAEREIGAHLVAHFNATLREAAASREDLQRSWLAPGETRYDALP